MSSMAPKNTPMETLTYTVCCALKIKQLQVDVAAAGTLNRLTALSLAP